MEVQNHQLQTSSAQTVGELAKASQEVQARQARISSLEDEKAALIAKVRRLEPLEPSMYFLYLFWASPSVSMPNTSPF